MPLFQMPCPPCLFAQSEFLNSVNSLCTPMVMLEVYNFRCCCWRPFRYVCICAGIGLMQSWLATITVQGQAWHSCQCSPEQQWQLIISAVLLGVVARLEGKAVAALWSPTSRNDMGNISKGKLSQPPQPDYTISSFTEVPKLFWLGFRLAGGLFSLEREDSSASIS